MKIILVLLMVCGKPDTVIVKFPDKEPIYTHKLHSPAIMKDLMNILKTDPIIIKYEEDRGTCS